LNLDATWIFGQLSNDVELLVIFTKKFIEKNRLELADEALKRIQDLEPSSHAFSNSKIQVERARAIEELRRQGISVENLSTLSGIEFESLVFYQFEKLHFSVLRTPVSGDYGADLIVENSEGTRYIIQCKRFASRVNLKAVQEVVAAKKHYSGDFAIVITNNEFLTSAIELAKSNQIELWNGDRLLKFLSGDIGFSLLADGHHPLQQ
jgi:HJR/Mrr/RecB family endonuclease